jgi:hypothetical protein
VKDGVGAGAGDGAAAMKEKEGGSGAGAGVDATKLKDDTAGAGADDWVAAGTDNPWKKEPAGAGAGEGATKLNPPAANGAGLFSTGDINAGVGAVNDVLCKPANISDATAGAGAGATNPCCVGAGKDEDAEESVITVAARPFRPTA